MKIMFLKAGGGVCTAAKPVGPLDGTAATGFAPFKRYISIMVNFA